jgi:hypothetical protein
MSPEPTDWDGLQCRYCPVPFTVQTWPEAHFEPEDLEDTKGPTVIPVHSHCCRSCEQASATEPSEAVG